MKQRIFKTAAILMLATASLLMVAFTANQAQPKEFTIKLNPAQTQALFYVMDKSSAEHNIVSEIQNVISQQVKTQLAPADSTKQKTPSPKK